MKPVDDPRIVFFDLETGGLDSKKHPIIELGAVAVTATTYEVVEDFHMRIQFDPKKCEPKTLSLAKYDPELWAVTAVPEVLVAEYFAQFLRRNPYFEYKNKYGNDSKLARLAGHNAKTFDAPFIQEWYRQKKKWLPASKAVLDTLLRAEWFFEENPHFEKPENHKLGTLAAYFKAKTIPDHTALNDSHATLEFYRAMRQLTLPITQPQHLYFQALAEQTGLSERKILNRAINSLTKELDLAA